ncbi:RlpA-like double-psi beta-barrel-protein domain-containing protein-containing protein [Stachybotrys elegans]|uniref:RlpA-like double-psi beta-barrel-protein domain-containing protein-containing protein n=1 Tax=Stachybotrys elegans TaxID=80388 RepID=A0A8K0SR76_9HYPO|nr:RlpA-like double-psi beta-barrel-protein domain-containing protein-containing protein [Stachybotrys elegans]
MHSLTNVLAIVAIAATNVAAFDGRMTWFNPGLGACGGRDNDGSPVVALNPAQYAGGANCGRWITIQANGRTTAARVVDLCPGCPNGGIDVSPVIFDDIAPLSVGVVDPVHWFFQ